MSVPILSRRQRWECLSCHATYVTTEPRPHTPFHNCPGLALLSIPYVPAGTRGKNTANERGDYVGAEDVTLDAEGRPVMSVTTTRDDGEDATVYAPCAHITIRTE